MAEANFGDFAARPGAGRLAASGRAINLVAALSSAGLAIGAGVWAWQIAMRDISGVPVIRAIEGPMRIAPEDPGGQIASYTGLSVNRVIADADPSATAAGQVSRAPAPLTLSAEDAPGLGLVARPQTDLPEAPPAAEAMLQAVLPDVPLTAAPPQPDPAITATDSAADSAAGLPSSLRPLPRPAGLGAPSRANATASGGDPVAAALASAMAALAPLASEGVREIDAASLLPGTRLVQLGTHDTPEAARAAWQALSSRAGALMAGKARLIEAAQIGGQTFYRLRVQGFDTEDAARRFCAAVGTSAQSCVVITHR